MTRDRIGKCAALLALLLALAPHGAAQKKDKKKKKEDTNTAPAARPGAAPTAASPNEAVPDLSGLWESRPGGTRIISWDPQDPGGQNPDGLKMAPWAAEKTRAAHPPFGAKQTFDAINDPVQQACDPPGLTRIYLYPWEMRFVQTPEAVYILYEFTRVWREIPLNAQHSKDPDKTWLGESVGRYEGDTLVIDTIGFNDKTWLDHVGHPHSEELHVVERFRRLDDQTMELTLTIEDPKAYPQPLGGTKLFRRANSPMGEAVCAYSEMKAFEDQVIKPAATPPAN